MSTDDQPRFLETGEYHDFTINCAGRVWNVHKMILRSRSDYFEKMLQHPFKETQSNEIILNEDHPATIQNMLCFMYSGNFTAASGDDRDGELSEIAQTFTTADKYSVEGLKLICLDKFEHAVKRLGLDDRFFKAARLVYPSPLQSGDADRRLREMVREICWNNMGSLMGNTAFQNLLTLRVDLAIDLVRLASQARSVECKNIACPNRSMLVWNARNCYNCPGCMQRI
ncbi:MAG: hypothetical protein M1825_003374 [Sarcosagium campestre]|nr:MAG: hypothetical protein M1825_003374 [Sarcosagium campestre]